MRRVLRLDGLLLFGFGGLGGPLLGGAFRGSRVALQDFIVEQTAISGVGVPEVKQFLFGSQRVFDCVERFQRGVRAFRVRDGGNQTAPRVHRGFVLFPLRLVALDFRGGLRVIIRKQAREKVVGGVGRQGGDFQNAVDSPRPLGEIAFAVGEANRALIALHFHKAAQIHRLPHVVFRAALHFNAQARVFAVLFLRRVEHHDDVLLQLVEAEVHQSVELPLDDPVSFQGQGTVALSHLGILMDCPEGHQGNQPAARVEHQRVEVPHVLRRQVAENFLVSRGLDIGLTVAGFDTVNAEVHVNVERLGRGESQRTLADSGIPGNQHTDFLLSLADVIGASNHSLISFRFLNQGAITRRHFCQQAFLSRRHFPRCHRRYPPVPRRGPCPRLHIRNNLPPSSPRSIAGQAWGVSSWDSRVSDASASSSA